MNLGVIRKLDPNGRVQIPTEIREALGLIDDSQLNVYMEKGKIVIAPVRSITETLNCAVCAKQVIVPVAPVHAVVVCDECMKRWGNKEVCK